MQCGSLQIRGCKITSIANVWITALYEPGRFKRTVSFNACETSIGERSGALQCGVTVTPAAATFMLRSQQTTCTTNMQVSQILQVPQIFSAA